MLSLWQFSLLLHRSCSVIHASGNDVASEDNLSKTPAIYNSNLSEPITQQLPKITVVASFFPIYEFAKQVGGDRVNIMTLIPAGVEPQTMNPRSNSYNKQKMQM